MTTQIQEEADRYVFRGTNKHKGRKISISPQNSSMKHLEYGRIILDEDVSKCEFDSGGREVGLICLSGECSVDIGGEENQLEQFDSIYIPRGSTVTIMTSSSVDLAECSAEV